MHYRVDTFERIEINFSVYRIPESFIFGAWFSTDQLDHVLALVAKMGSER
jgi:hypothetical protein